MSFTVHHADTVMDADAIARLLGFVESEPVTAEIVRDRQRKLPPDATQIRLLARDADENIVGMAPSL